MTSQNESGFTLVETMLSAGLASLAILGFAEIQNQQSRFMKSANITISRNNLLSNIHMAANQPASMKKSAALTINPELARCLSATGTCIDGVQYPFTLVDATSAILADRSDQSHVGFNLNGAPCTPGMSNNDCPILADSSFSVSCPRASNGDCTAYFQIQLAAGGWPEATITTFYRVSQNPAANLPVGQLQTLSNRAMVDWKLVTSLTPAPH